MSNEQIVELTVMGLAAGGDGVGRDDGGRVIFVPGTAPGDRVRARVVSERKSFARAELVDVLVPGPARVTAACPVAGECGGCQWQHVSRAAQQEAKQQLVSNALRRQLEQGLELRPLLAPVEPLGWRRRARLHWVRRRRGEVVLGFFRQRSQQIIDIPGCPQLVEPLQQALAAVREHLADALHGKGELSLVAGHQGQVHISARGAVKPKAMAGVVGTGGIVGASQGRQRWGAASVELEPGLQTDAAAFAQASLAGNLALLELVDVATQPRAGAAVLELYAGAGNLTRRLRLGAGRVVAVESELPEALPPADSSGPDQGARVTWKKQQAEAVVAELVERGQSMDLVVLDPPRTGAAELVPGLVALAAPRIVYVSCDPATLARDVERLAAGGYRPVWAQALDMMPHTSQVEVVLQLVREEQASPS